jgi:hypothetical protein
VPSDPGNPGTDPEPDLGTDPGGDPGPSFHIDPSRYPNISWLYAAIQSGDAAQVRAYLNGAAAEIVGLQVDVGGS